MNSDTTRLPLDSGLDRTLVEYTLVGTNELRSPSCCTASTPDLLQKSNVMRYCHERTCIYPVQTPLQLIHRGGVTFRLPLNGTPASRGVNILVLQQIAMTEIEICFMFLPRAIPETLCSGRTKRVQLRNYLPRNPTIQCALRTSRHVTGRRYKRGTIQVQFASSLAIRRRTTDYLSAGHFKIHHFLDLKVWWHPTQLHAAQNNVLNITRLRGIHSPRCRGPRGQSRTESSPDAGCRPRTWCLLHKTSSPCASFWWGC